MLDFTTLYDNIDPGWEGFGVVSLLEIDGKMNHVDIFAIFSSIATLIFDMKS